MKFREKVNIGSANLSDKNANRSLFVRRLTMQHRSVYKRFARVNVPALIYCYRREWRGNKFSTNVYNEIRWYFPLDANGRTMTVRSIKTETSSLPLA